MKILYRTLQLSLILLFVGLFTSCNKAKDETPNADNPKSDATAMLNIRYNDKDSLLHNYNLANDLSEAMLCTSDNYENIQRQKANEIQKFAAQIENKYKTNGYLSEASFNADQQKLQKMQQDAQAYLANLERNIQNELLQHNIQLNDSVETFITAYNKAKGYEIIFDKAACLFIDEKYDITDEIIKGLNERYNKVESK